MNMRHAMTSACVILAACAGPNPDVERATHARAQGQVDKVTADVRAENAKLQIQVEELNGQLRAAREQIARTERERQEIRDELLKLKIAQEEAERARDRERKPETAAARREPPAGAAAAPERGAAPSDPELKRRLRELVRELEEILQRPESTGRR